MPFLQCHYSKSSANLLKSTQYVTWRVGGKLNKGIFLHTNVTIELGDDVNIHCSFILNLWEFISFPLTCYCSNPTYDRANKKNKQKWFNRRYFPGCENAAEVILCSTGLLMFCYITGKMQKIPWFSLLKKKKTFLMRMNAPDRWVMNVVHLYCSLLREGQVEVSEGSSPRKWSGIGKEFKSKTGPGVVTGLLH